MHGSKLEEVSATRSVSIILTVHEVLHVLINSIIIYLKDRSNTKLTSSSYCIQSFQGTNIWSNLVNNLINSHACSSENYLKMFHYASSKFHKGDTRWNVTHIDLHDIVLT